MPLDPPDPIPPQLDDQSPITPLQSATVRAALGIILTGTCSILATVGVSAVYIDEFNHFAAPIISVVGNIITIYFGFKAIKARINATETIRKG